MTVQRVHLAMAMLLALVSALLIGSPASADRTPRDHAVERGKFTGTASAAGPLADAVTTTSIAATVLTPSAVYQFFVRARGGCSATVTNTGTSAITSRTVTFTLPAGHAIVGSWNAALTSSARNMFDDGNLSPSSSTTFGFQASRPNGNTSVCS
jgi:hypothetical protein